MGALQRPVVVAYARAAVGRSGKKGVFRQLHPVDLGGLVLKGVLEQKIPQLDPALIEDVILGCAHPEKMQGYNPAKLMVARAGLPDSVPAMTLTRFCASGLQAIADAAMRIEVGMNDILVAGGMESMSQNPLNIDRSMYEAESIRECDPDQYMPMGLTAENVAVRYGITREQMDAYAVDCHKKAAAAQDAGRFADSIIPVPGVDVDGNPILVTEDQGIRRGANLESMAALNPCFKEDGVVTAATSSQTSDSAAFLVLMSEEKALELGLKPIAYFRGFATAGCEAGYMGLGPIYAVPKAMEVTSSTELR